MAGGTLTLPTRRSSLLLGRGPAEPERVPWDGPDGLGAQFIASWGRPRGKPMPEHLSVYGQTGSGKSFFERWVLAQRAARRGSHIVLLCTKPADKTITGLGWPVVDDWPPGYGKKQVIYWAKQPGKPGDPEGIYQQRLKVVRLLDELWVPDSNIVLAIDEVAYLVEDLGLRRVVTRYYREARALGITIVGTTQRPAGVVRQMHSEAGWQVAFAPTDEDDAKRMAEVLGNRRHYMEQLAQLDRERYEFLIIRKLTGEAYISHIPARSPKPRSTDQNRTDQAQRQP